MKKWMQVAATSAVLLGVMGLSQTALADDATGSTTSETAKTTAETKASVYFGAGTLSLSNTTDAVAFNTSDSAFSTEDVWAKGLTATEADNKLTATVDDFLGVDDDTWTLTVKKGNWVADTDGTAQGATALDTGATLTTDSGEITTAGLVYETGSAGSLTIPEQAIKLAIAKGTLVKKGAYSNTLTWNLADDASTTQS